MSNAFDQSCVRCKGRGAYVESISGKLVPCICKDGTKPDAVSPGGAMHAVHVLLKFIGEDPERAGLKLTPRRFVSALFEMTAGVKDDPKAVLGTVFEEYCDEVVILRRIPFVSLCEHHLLPYTGTADIGYLPGLAERTDEDNKGHGVGSVRHRVVGLSKLARLVDCFARRLQMQERMTRQIAEAVQEHLRPQGVGVVVRGEHSCMSCRGVQKYGTEMMTSSMLGVFREKPEARAELLTLFNS